jgi:hypothetical protein
MTYTASAFVQRFMDATQDPTNVRWTAPEVIRYANDGQREIAMYRPDAFATNTVFTCAAGSKQALPAGATKLISVTRNGTTGRVVTPIKREMLDATVPGWHGTAQAAEVLHTMYDERDPLVFYTYPPATVAATLQMHYANTPTDIPTPSTNFLAGVSGNLSVADLFVNALLDYTLFRAYSKDSEFAANQGRADAALARFAQALGIEIKTTLAFSPNQNSPLNPAMPASATKPQA